MRRYRVEHTVDGLGGVGGPWATLETDSWQAAAAEARRLHQQSACAGIRRDDGMVYLGPDCPFAAHGQAPESGPWVDAEGREI